MFIYPYNVTTECMLSIEKRSGVLFTEKQSVVLSTNIPSQISSETRASHIATFSG